MTCEVCGLGPAPEDGGVTVYRATALSGLPAGWRCRECREKPADPETQRLVDVLEGRAAEHTESTSR